MSPLRIRPLPMRNTAGFLSRQCICWSICRCAVSILTPLPVRSTTRRFNFTLQQGMVSIYQEMIAKASDVRMVLLGTTVYSYSLHTPNGALDWRQEVGQGHVTLEEIVTSAHLGRAGRAFFC